MAAELDVGRYLKRIGFPGQPTVDLASLTALQRCHMGSVPFENLHVFHQAGVRLDLDWSIPKVLAGGGGWCFEINGTFCELLRAIGFEVDLVGAVVLLGERPRPLETHVTLIVSLEGVRYLVDVGFGDNVTKPMLLDSTVVVIDAHGEFRIVPEPDETFLLQFQDSVSDEGVSDGAVADETALDEGASDERAWADQFRFTTRPRQVTDFVEGEHLLKTDPSSKFIQKPFATRLIPGGRVTLLSDRIKFREFGVEREMPVAEDEWSALLREWFDMIVPSTQ